MRQYCSIGENLMALTNEKLQSYAMSEDQVFATPT